MKKNHPHSFDRRLRCYLRRSGRNRGRWVAHCIDLNLWAVGDSMDAAKRSLEDAIRGYVRTVLRTKDVESIARLLNRRAPLRYVALWHFGAALVAIRETGWPLSFQLFREPYPVPA